jgi:hypothetical protein
MANQSIQTYAVFTKPGQNYYRVGLTVASGIVHYRDVAGPEELRALVDLLRYEKPCWFDPDTSLLTVGFEPVGEGEEPRPASPAA